MFFPSANCAPNPLSSCVLALKKSYLMTISAEAEKALKDMSILMSRMTWTLKNVWGGGGVAFHGLCPSNSWPLTIIWIYYWTLTAPQHHYSTYNDSFCFRGEQLCHSGFPQQYLGESNKTNNITPSGCHADPNIRMYSSASAWRPWLWPILSVGMVPPKHERTEKWRGDARTDASPPKRRQLFGNNSAGHPAHLQLCGLSVQSSFSFFMAFPWRAITTPWILLSHINTHFILQAYVK